MRIILDHAGSTFTHGRAEDHVEWTLDEDKRAEAPAHSLRQRDGSRSRLVTCHKCSAVRMAGEPCPQCGWYPKTRADSVDFIDGELARVDRHGQVQPIAWPQRRRTGSSASCSGLRERGDLSAAGPPTSSRNASAIGRRSSIRRRQSRARKRCHGSGPATSPGPSRRTGRLEQEPQMGGDASCSPGHVRKLLHDRYGPTVPNDDAGTDDLRILLHVKAQCYHPPRREQALINEIEIMAPWMTDERQEARGGNRGQAAEPQDRHPRPHAQSRLAHPRETEVWQIGAVDHGRRSAQGAPPDAASQAHATCPTRSWRKTSGRIRGEIPVEDEALGGGGHLTPDLVQPPGPITPLHKSVRAQVRL